jgi:Subtilase family
VNVEEFQEIFHRQRALGWPHTVDSPIRYEVWRDFALKPGDRVDLLLEVVQPGANTLNDLIRLLESAEADMATSRPALAGDIAAVRVRFEVFFDAIVGQTDWRDLLLAGRGLTPAQLAEQLDAALRMEREGAIDPGTDPALPRTEGAPPPTRDLVERFRWFILLVARIGYVARRKNADLQEFPAGPRSGAVHYLQERFEHATRPVDPTSTPTELSPSGALASLRFESVSVNRPASIAAMPSRATVKADAASRLFEIDASSIGWAVLDSGIDATHMAFRKLQADGTPYPQPFGITQGSGERVNLTRVIETRDLRTAREWFSDTPEQRANLLLRLLGTKTPMFDLDGYVRPTHDHGTHIAGILGGNWVRGPGQEAHVGVCPTVNLYDLRVLGDNGEGDEFSVIAGLRLVKALNDEAGRLVIHGVNLSLSMVHHVANYACGWTPVCRACEELIASGVVVVASAGNAGFVDPDPQQLRASTGTGYNVVSITDPGNAEKVITVGATHTSEPHKYGTSYFSARGPTADGRPKPDLLAPGQRIEAPVPSELDHPELKSYDGTSQAAAHVSGAAALLLARYRELWGQPERVKAILTGSATDLNRERYFQGYGLVDILRALQSI